MKLHGIRQKNMLQHLYLPKSSILTWEMNSVDCHDITTQEQLMNKQKVAQIIKEIHCRKHKQESKHQI
jgi:hypothetical protein